MNKNKREGGASVKPVTAEALPKRAESVDEPVTAQSAYDGFCNYFHDNPLALQGAEVIFRNPNLSDEEKIKELNGYGRQLKFQVYHWQMLAQGGN